MYYDKFMLDIKNKYIFNEYFKEIDMNRVQEINKKIITEQNSNMSVLQLISIYLYDN